MTININIPEYEVSQFNRLLKEVLETNFDYVRIKGEISELKNASSGHLYLTLKDHSSILNATIWKQKKNYLQVKPEIGMEVIITGKISTYAKSISTYSINIDKLELAGQGALLKLIEDRKKKLNEKGVFDDNHKKNIPYLPNKIGVITSSTGSVIHDIINRIKDRFPTNIDIWPVSVQGLNSAQEIIEAIHGFHRQDYKNKPDVIIIARGGGSTEDLMAFNDEKLALTVYNSIIPIISAIGHETDTTIIDLVSDLRASTPTAAAEKVVPVRLQLFQIIFNLSKKLSYILESKHLNVNNKLFNLIKFLKAPNHIINSYQNKFSFLRDNLFGKIENIHKDKIHKLLYLSNLLRSPEKDRIFNRQSLKNLDKDLNTSFNGNITFKKRELIKLSRLLKSNSLYTNLEKGYSVVRKAKKIINKESQINKNDSLNIQFLDKSVNINIKKIN